VPLLSRRPRASETAPFVDFVILGDVGDGGKNHLKETPKPFRGSFAKLSGCTVPFIQGLQRNDAAKRGVISHQSFRPSPHPVALFFFLKTMQIKISSNYPSDTNN
jgi:hypothetical protein